MGWHTSTKLVLIGTVVPCTPGVTFDAHWTLISSSSLSLRTTRMLSLSAASMDDGDANYEAKAWLGERYWAMQTARSHNLNCNVQRQNCRFTIQGWLVLLNTLCFWTLKSTMIKGLFKSSPAQNPAGPSSKPPKVASSFYADTSKIQHTAHVIFYSKKPSQMQYIVACRHKDSPGWHPGQGKLPIKSVFVYTGYFEYCCKLIL